MGIVERQIQPLVSAFRLPRYDELPKMGLYLDQVVKYINGYFPEAMGIKMTNTMVSSYVKHGLLNHPQHRQYDRGQLASLFLITISRQGLSFMRFRPSSIFGEGSKALKIVTIISVLPSSWPCVRHFLQVTRWKKSPFRIARKSACSID